MRGIDCCSCGTLGTSTGVSVLARQALRGIAAEALSPGSIALTTTIMGAQVLQSAGIEDTEVARALTDASQVSRERLITDLLAGFVVGGIASSAHAPRGRSESILATQSDVHPHPEAHTPTPVRQISADRAHLEAIPASAASSRLRHRALGNSEAHAMVQRISPTQLPAPARRIWARALDLWRDNPGVPVAQLMTELDASEFMPLLRNEGAIIVRRKAEVRAGAPHPFSELEAFIAEHVQSGRLNYREMLRFMELHDGVMSTNGTESSIIRGAELDFPMVVYYPEPAHLNVRDINHLWNIFAGPLGHNSDRFFFDGTQIDYLGEHDTVHMEQRTVDPRLSSFMQGRSLNELEQVISIHGEAYRTYLAHARRNIPNQSARTHEDLAELLWTMVDHENNNVWRSILLPRLFSPNFSPARDLHEFKTRLREMLHYTGQTVRRSDPHLATRVRIFIGHFSENFFDESIRDPGDRAALRALNNRMLQIINAPGTTDADLLVMNLRNDPVHGRAMGMILNAVENFQQWLGVPVEADQNP